MSVWPLFVTGVIYVCAQIWEKEKKVKEILEVTRSLSTDEGLWWWTESIGLTEWEFKAIFVRFSPHLNALYKKERERERERERIWGGGGVALRCGGRGSREGNYYAFLISGLWTSVEDSLSRLSLILRWLKQTHTHAHLCVTGNSRIGKLWRIFHSFIYS